jgi:predicted amidophosphoribosyltransferase
MLKKVGLGIKEVLFPSFCLMCSSTGEIVCRKCLNNISLFEGRCVKCSRKNPLGLICPRCQGKYEPDLARAKFRYKSSAKNLISAFKYDDITDLADLFGKELAKLIKKAGDYKDYCLVPIPLSASRKRYRGYNQAGLIATAVGKRLCLEVKPVLKRLSFHQDLVGYGRKDRLRLIKIHLVWSTRLLKK